MSARAAVVVPALCASAVLIGLVGCKAKASDSSASAPFMSTIATTPPTVADDAPAPDKTGGFDGKLAFEHVAKLVAFGPRPSGSAAIIQSQDYIIGQLKSFGCAVDTDSFSADTPVGRLSMKNIVAKIPGERRGIILLGTHYDTKRLENFVGADDGGSSTGVMLELARLLCHQHGRYAVWIAFFDGEEATLAWKDNDFCYGSREMAARMALSGDLPKIKALLLADIVGTHTPHFRRETSSTKWLTDLVWSTAARLGYSDIFLQSEFPVQDDHDSFLVRKVPAADVIDLDTVNDVPYWHTPQDNLDKISARSLAIVGHVFLESVKELQAR